MNTLHTFGMGAIGPMVGVTPQEGWKWLVFKNETGPFLKWKYPPPIDKPCHDAGPQPAQSFARTPVKVVLCARARLPVLEAPSSLNHLRSVQFGFARIF